MTNIGPILGQTKKKIGYNGVGFWPTSGTYPAKIDPSDPPGEPGGQQALTKGKRPQGYQGYHIHSEFLGNPCTDGNYQRLEEDDRSVTTTSSTIKCDDDEITNWSVWYRVSGDAGNALASKNAPQTNSCGSDVPVYLKDDHPSYSEGEVTRKACSATANNQCFVENDIQVINCGAFYLYNLVRWRPCNSNQKKWRYCTNGQGTLYM